MHVAYKRLLQIHVRHGWYAQGASTDFTVAPTATTRAWLEARGLRVRAESDGLSVFVEVEPGSVPPTLRRSLGGDTVALAFTLELGNPELFNVTSLGAFEPARAVFVFDNLSENVTAGRKRLGDSVAHQVLGPAARLVTGGTVTHTFAVPVAEATLTLRDRFGAIIATEVARAPVGAALREWRFELAGRPRVAPGRYSLGDEHGNVVALYFDPSLAASRPLGVIEIFSRTEALTPDGTDRVPASYRFLSGDTLVDTGGYFVELESRSTVWRYVVTKAYPNNGVELDKLSIAGPVGFVTPTVEASRAVFRSSAPVPLAEAQRGLTLRHDGRRLRDLPEPDRSTPVGRDAATGADVSDVFVNV